MKYVPLNFALLRNPYNWFVVVLMVALAGLAFAAIFPQVSITNQDEQK